MGLNVVLSITLAAWFEQLGLLPHGGLALANTIATTLEMFVLLALMRSRLSGLNGRKVLRGFLQASAGAAAMGAAILGWLNLSENLWVQVAGVAFGAGVYGVMLLVLQVDEARTLFAAIRSRIAN